MYQKVRDQQGGTGLWRQSKHPLIRTYFFEVWQIRLLYFGVLIGNLGRAGFN